MLGGYGNFGRQIAVALAQDRVHRVFVAGRDPNKAKKVADEIGEYADPIALDCHAPDFAAKLRSLDAALVVHTAGPFQTQRYSVPRACIEARAHYIDLADGRTYVCRIRQLDAEARNANTLVVSGASSLPALSAAVVDTFKDQFSSIDTIEHGITSGARPPGVATMEGVLGYAGKPFSRWSAGTWHRAYGWQDIKVRRYPAPVGVRWLASCDVPDLELFRERYAPVNTIAFRAGVGFAASTLVVWAASWLVRAGLLSSLTPQSARLHRVASSIERFGSEWSAMHVTLSGLDRRGQSASRTWSLLAGSNHGPRIPCFPAIALARKVLRNEVSIRGAMPCVGLLGLNEILEVGRGLDLHVDTIEPSP